MSRSIHANMSLKHRRREGGIDWPEMRLKWGYKQATARSRTTGPEELPTTEPGDVPIRILDESPYLFFPASIDDLRAVLAALPRGVTTGLAEIRLELGRRLVNEFAGSHYDMVEPHLGRACVESVHGVWLPRVLGVYDWRAQHVRLFGYSKPPTMKLTRRQQTTLELRMLRTLVHEISHHDDRMHRVGRGRNGRTQREKAETFAQRMTLQWTLEVVLPVMEAKYGHAEAVRLRHWATQDGGGKRWRKGISHGEQDRTRRARLSALSPKSRRWVTKPTRNAKKPFWPKAAREKVSL